MPKVLLVCRDIFFQSMVCDAARAKQLRYGVCCNLDELSSNATADTVMIIFDLTTCGPLDRLPELVEQIEGKPELVAFGPHVDVDLLRAARRFGCDPVMPRSQFVERLAEMLGRWEPCEPADEVPPVEPSSSDSAPRTVDPS